MSSSPTARTEALAGVHPVLDGDHGAQPQSLDQRSGRRQRFALSLFWRTFFLVALLLASSILAWLQTFSALEFEPRAVQTANQVASMVNLSRAALVHADAIARVPLIKAMAEQEGVRIFTREPGDRFEALDQDAFSRRVAQELSRRLGEATVVAHSVNGQPGFWIGFQIDGDDYWLRIERSRFDAVGGATWLIWLVIAAALSVAGAALIARLVNRPLRQLSFAATRVREGDFEASHLDETVSTNEIREVNVGFNRMARQLAKLDQDRAVMLAGISHDLRTPLARLRLEAELSVADAQARQHMSADIDQLDAIIDKFLDYARPEQARLAPVPLLALLQGCVLALRDAPELSVQLDVPAELAALGDATDLARIVSNLLENARRYGRGTDGLVRVDIAAREQGGKVLLRLRDHGSGAAQDALPNLTKPFYRADGARTAARGAGLGLAIVEKTVQRMGGSLSLGNASDGGFFVLLRLQPAT
jgi:two-component system osmolarity sensor histidine kinase EnvZ